MENLEPNNNVEINQSIIQPESPRNYKKIIVLIIIGVILAISLGFIIWKIYIIKKKPTAAKNTPSVTLDKNLVIVTKKVRPLKIENGTAFECVEGNNDEIDTNGYEVKDGKVYYLGFILEGADPGSLKIIGEGDSLAKDKNYVYIFGNPIKQFDAETFDEVKSGDDQLLKDKNGVYITGNIRKKTEISNAEDIFYSEDKQTKNCYDLIKMTSWDAQTVGDTIEITGVLEDRKFIIKKLENLDPLTAKIASEDMTIGTYLSDKNSVYLLDYTSDSPYSDENKFFNLVKIDGSDSTSFSVINDFYFKDKNSVFSSKSNPGKMAPEFTKIEGADPASFTVQNHRDPGLSPWNFYYIGITAEDKNNYYARELAIPKGRKVNDWVGSLDKIPMTCEAVCKKNNLEFSADGCYDQNLDKCSVSKSNICIKGGSDYLVKNDYMTDCCCSGSQFSWEYPENKQTNFCVSTDGFDPFIKGVTRGSTNSGGRNDTFWTTQEDECKGNYLIDYFCGLGAQVVSMGIDGIFCPNGCENGACKPFDKNSVTQMTTKWENDKLSFEYNPMSFYIKTTQDGMIHLYDKKTNFVYASLSSWKITNGLTFDMLYNDTKSNTADYRNVEIVQIGKYKFIKYLNIWAKTGKKAGIDYSTIIDGKYQLNIDNNLAYHTDTKESIDTVEKIISSIVFKNY